MTSGSVVANFSTGDPLLSLSAVAIGRWTGTWQARNATNAAVTITVNAQLARRRFPERVDWRQFAGEQDHAGDQRRWASNAVSLVVGRARLPGSLVAIKGSNLGKGLSTASHLPLGHQSTEPRCLSPEN